MHGTGSLSLDSMVSYQALSPRGRHKCVRLMYNLVRLSLAKVSGTGPERSFRETLRLRRPSMFPISGGSVPESPLSLRYRSLS